MIAFYSASITLEQFLLAEVLMPKELKKSPKIKGILMFHAGMNGVQKLIFIVIKLVFVFG